MVDSDSSSEDGEEMARLKEATAGVDTFTKSIKTKEKEKKHVKDEPKDGSAIYLTRLLDDLIEYTKEEHISNGKPKPIKVDGIKLTSSSMLNLEAPKEIRTT